MKHIERLRTAVRKAIGRGCTGQNFIKQLTITEAECLISDYDLLLGEVKAFREHYAQYKGDLNAMLGLRTHQSADEQGTGNSGQA